jgi:autotransporter-associated beta strand protein
MGSLANSASAQTWIGPTGNFSVANNWLGATAPVLGTVATPVNLTFFAGNAGAVTATNDLGSPWVAKSLAFNVNNAFTMQGSVSTNLFQLVGPSPSITMSGLGSAAVSLTGGNIQLAGNTTIGGAGPANITLSGVISEDFATSGVHRSLTISGGAALRELRMVSLASSANTFAGGLILDGGTVTTGSFGPGVFGAAGSTLTVTANGGTINDSSNMSSGCSLATIQLNGDLHIIGTGVAMPLVSGSASTLLNGPGSLIVNTTNSTSMTLYSNSTGFTGAFIIDQSELPQFTGSAGGVALSSIGALNGLNGAITNAASIDIRAGGTLNLTNSITNSLQNGNRIGDTTPVRLRSANFTLNGPAQAGTSGFNPAPLTENIGTLIGAGMSAVTVLSSTGAVTTTLNPSSLSRVERGTFLFRGTSLGDGTVATRGNITFTSDPSGSLVGGGGAPGSINISIFPYAIGGTTTTDNGSSFVTYDANGVRLLTASEYLLDDLSGGITTANVKLDNGSSGVAAATEVPVNSLLLATNGANTGSVTGTGTLDVTSGAILCTTTAAATITPTVNFGSTEGVIYCTGAGGLTISGALTGSNGLTKSGAVSASAAANTLTLTGSNTGLTGPLTMNAGSINFNALAALPGTGAITANGSAVLGFTSSAVSLTYSGTTPLTLGRAVAVNTGFMTFAATDTGTGGSLTLDQQISGAGSVNLQAGTADIFVTGTGNIYTGKTRFSAGNIHIAGDGSTGAGGGWSFGNGATLTLEGNVGNSRAVNFEGGANGATINTNGHDMTLSGPMVSFGGNGLTASSTGTITKNGAGTLTLTNAANTVGLAVMVNGGALVVNGNLGANSAAGGLSVNSGAVLAGSGTIYRNTWGYVRTGAGSVASPFIYSGNGGIVAPGSSGPGILTFWGSLDLAPAKVAGGTAPNVVGTPAAGPSTLSMKLNGPVAGTGYDQIQTFLQNGSPASQVILGDGTATWAANLSLSLGYAPSASDVFWLILNTNAYQANLGTANTTTGTFAGLPEGATVTLGTVAGRTYTAKISYKGDFATSNPTAGTGNDVVLYGVDYTPKCGSADFNCDGDVGTDLDIEAFFACLAGSCPPPPCTGSADFNADGDVGTDADIEAFFRVLAGGSC